MEGNFKEIRPEDIGDNPFSLIGETWMLITAGTRESFNTMTASWGGLGVLWNKQIATCFVRPTRHTYGFMETAAGFSLCFFDERHRKILDYCGSRSGRNVDKVAKTGLVPVFGGDAIYFEQARLVIECRKVYTFDIDPARFVDQGIDKLYPEKDYHRAYIGEIIRCLAKQGE